MRTSGKRTNLLRVIATVLTLVLILGTVVPAMAAGYDLDKFAGPDNLEYEGQFYSEFGSLEEVFAAAKELNGEIVAEGAVLMKNDGTLPLNPRYDRISVLGVRSGDLREGVDGTVVAPNEVASMATGLRNAGFKVNPTLEKWYARLGTKLEMNEVGIEGFEPLFSKAVMRSLENYDDVAVVVIQRCDMKENVGGSVALTGHTTNSGDPTDPVNGSLAGNRANDSIRQIQDAVKEGTEETDPYGWKHAHSAQSPAEEGETPTVGDNVEVKHSLQLTDSEIALIDFAKENFDRVLVLFNSSHTFEMYNLEKDPEINGLLWFGRPGIQETGITAVAEILSGVINPSGGASAEYVRDFTADPTWMNTSTGRQFRYDAYSEDVPGDYVYRYPDEDGKYLTIAPGGTGTGGMRGVEYEEGIYLGYKYYETFWNEIAQGNTSLTEGADPSEYQAIADAWHDFNVVYPFGYGQSYTTFTMEIQGLYTDAKCKEALDSEVEASLFASSVEGGEAQVKKLYIPVKVTNTGDVAGKKSVQIYVTAPYYTGEIEKSFVKLVGFGKTRILKPGRSETVIVEIDVQDVASFDYNDANGNGHAGWELDAGDYIFRAMSCSSVLVSERDGMYDDITITLDETAIMELDSFSGNEAVALFSDPDEIDYSIRTGAFNEDPDAKMTILSRADMEGTFPAPPTLSDLIITQEAIDREKQVVNMNTGNNFNGFFGDILADEASSIDSPDLPWYVEAIPENWTQQNPETVNDDRVDGKTLVQLYQMAGVPLDGSILVDGEEFTWDDFMNQLTYAEMKGLWGSTPGAIAAIGKARDANADRPLNLGGTFTWADAPLQAATFNTKLIRRMGQLCGEFDLQKGPTGTSGWWGPGSNINRSQFAGRTKEYYSQDAILNGYMAAAAVSGAQSKGTNVYIKHCALYDQEDLNAGTTVWVDEQTMRENYLAAFKKAMQDGGSAGAMISCWRIGQEQIAHNYDFITGIFMNEWGWFGEWVTDHTGGQGGENWTNPLAPEGETKYNWRSGNFNSQEVILRNGGLTIMGSGAGALKGVWDASLRDGKGGVNVTFGSGETAVTKESVEEYYYMRMMALKGLYKAANSKLVANGVQIDALKDQVVELKQAERANIPALLSEDQLNGGDVEYKAEGTLPAGLSLNLFTGEISGTPTAVGDFDVAVTAIVDGWVKGSAKITFQVASPWTKDLPKGWVGEEYDGSVASNINESGTVSYRIASGELPAGLKIDSVSGVISGTPTAAGDYTFQVAVTFTSGTGSNARTTTYVSEEFTITVNAEEEE
ncbi:MAG: glycoside hydrolase family 3 C-terminal domain-containing protein [Lachnospiraceae bacterium]|nr:glycoside hydrolase family 3 C-terminal domain-containing protein [Lachnospiraceae bacterium]